MARPKNVAQKHEARINTILAIIFVAALAFMTVGFAAYGQILNMDGVVTVKPQGTIRIVDVVFDAANSQHATGSPTFTDTTVDFNLSFTTVNQQNSTYSATYIITIQNDTFYNQIFSIPNYIPTVKKNGVTVEDADINFALNGISNGDIIPKGESVTFSVVISLVPPDTGTYTVDDDMEIEFSDEQTGQLFASISGSTTGNLRSPNVRAAFTVSVINTFDYSREFTLSLVNNPHFYLANDDGTRPVGRTIAANSTQNYVVYVYANDPTMQYSSDYVRANIFLQANGITDINAGRITLLVDKIVIITDTDAPVISNFVAARQNTDGEVLLTWDAQDESTINNFTIQIYQGTLANGTLINTITTANDETSYTITGLNDGDYYFKIYGTDAHGNTATGNEVANATTGSGHAVRTNSTSYTWTYAITYNLNGVRSSNTATSIKIGQTYTTTLTAQNNSNAHPNSVTITMGGVTLSNTAYSYNANTGALSIPNATGNLTITSTYNTFCLIEGTEISLWGGTTKKIEDVDYDDLLKVWSYDLGKFVPAYPIWIEQVHIADSYRLITLSDGTTLGAVGYHSVFSVDAGKFVSVDDSNEFYEGIQILKDIDNKLVPVKVEKIEIVHQPTKFYNVVSTFYYNTIANDVLTADGMSIVSNLYGFTEDLRWPETRSAAMRIPDVLYKPSQFSSIPRYIFQGLRIQEAGVISNYYPADQLEAFLNDTMLNEEMLKPQTLKPSYISSSELGNSRYWLYNIEGREKLVKEGSTQTVPSGTWFNTADGKIYHGGDRIQIWTSVYLIRQ